MKFHQIWCRVCGEMAWDGRSDRKTDQAGTICLPFMEHKTRTVTKVPHTPTQCLVTEQVSCYRKKISWKCLNWLNLEVTGFYTLEVTASADPHLQIYKGE